MTPSKGELQTWGLPKDQTYYEQREKLMKILESYFGASLISAASQVILAK